MDDSKRPRSPSGEYAAYPREEFDGELPADRQHFVDAAESRSASLGDRYDELFPPPSDRRVWKTPSVTADDHPDFPTWSQPAVNRTRPTNRHHGAPGRTAPARASTAGVNTVEQPDGRTQSEICEAQVNGPEVPYPPVDPPKSSRFRFKR